MQFPWIKNTDTHTMVVRERQHDLPSPLTWAEGTEGRVKYIGSEGSEDRAKKQTNRQLLWDEMRTRRPVSRHSTCGCDAAWPCSLVGLIDTVLPGDKARA